MVGRDAYIAVYILSDGVRGTIYVGVTSNLPRRKVNLVERENLYWDDLYPTLPG